MTSVELVICLLLLLLAVPDLCERIGRPALAYTCYLAVGVLIGRYLDFEVAMLLRQIGRLGFILLLFEIGLEIDLPPVRHWWTPLKLVAKWTVLQYPIVVGLARAAGLSWTESIVASVALNGCSLSMTFLAWQHFQAPSEENRKHLLLWMISLEILAIVILTAASVALKEGFGASFAASLAAIVAVVVAISVFANALTGWVGSLLRATIAWRGHYLALFVFALSALGERLGLAAPKTAFFLGLFVTRTTHEGLELMHHLRPIGQRLLIPVFFVSLGATVPAHMLLKPLALMALGSALLLLLVRDLLHRTFVRSGCGRAAALLVSPNLTITAIAASIMISGGTGPRATAWLLLTSLFMSVISLALLPRPPAPRPPPGN